jgi:hypothetical protein
VTASAAGISSAAGSSARSFRRFLRERRLFPYETSSGSLRLAIAVPTDTESVRAVELALQNDVTLAVATAEDIEAALVTTLEPEEPRVVGSPETAAADDNLDDLRDLAGGAPVVRAVDDFLRPRRAARDGPSYRAFRHGPSGAAQNRRLAEDYPGAAHEHGERHPFAPEDHGGPEHHRAAHAAGRARARRDERRGSRPAHRDDADDAW